MPGISHADGQKQLIGFELFVRKGRQPGVRLWDGKNEPLLK